MGGAVTQLTEENFDRTIKMKDPMLIDFWAEWCGPCKHVGPIVEEIAKQYAGRVKVFKVNVDSAQNTAAKYQIMSIPTLLFMKGGKVMDRVTGAIPKRAIEEKLKQLIEG